MRASSVAYTLVFHALARRATPSSETLTPSPSSFNPRPRAEGDAAARPGWRRTRKFQSTPSRGGRRGHPRISPCRDGFNPRPRAEGDFFAMATLQFGTVFNPRRPRGGRLVDDCLSRRDSFQSTPSRRGRRANREARNPSIDVSIHASRGGRLCVDHPTAPRHDFNPRLARGGRSYNSVRYGLDHVSQSTPSRGGRRSRLLSRGLGSTCFNPRPRAEGDRIR